MESFDTIVIGTGGVGSATLHQLAKRGQRVLGLDRHPQAHSFGSSHGQFRIIRQAYFEHPDYVPLLLRVYELWRELEETAGASLFHQVGLVEVGPADGVLIPAVMQSVSQHDLEIEQLTAKETRERFPYFAHHDMQVVFEPTAGYLLVEDCVRAQLRLAVEEGATWRQESVLDWTAAKGEVQVRTADSSYAAEQLIICGGAWSASLLRDVGVKLQVIEKHQYWFGPPAGLPAEMPVFFFETSSGWFYGFPPMDGAGLKLAQHSGGRKRTGPFDLESARDDEDLEGVTRFAKTHFQGAMGELKSRQACMYTMSPDEHFILDRHPVHEKVHFAAGLSGHGFKFAPVLGLILAQLASGEEPELPVDFLRIDRLDGG